MILNKNDGGLVSYAEDNKKRLLALREGYRIGWKCGNTSCSNCMIVKILRKSFGLSFNDCGQSSRVLKVKEELLEMFNEILKNSKPKDGWKI